MLWDEAVAALAPGLQGHSQRAAQAGLTCRAILG
jgi:hypothetical protein